MAPGRLLDETTEGNRDHSLVSKFSELSKEAEEGDSEAVIPPHPLGIKPSGNAYTASRNIRPAIGSLAILPDELIIQLLEYLDARELVSLGSTCKALYAFGRSEDLWKALFIQ